MTSPGELLVVAGEVSGDLHAGNMLGELQRIRPDVSAFGIGGDRLQANGLELLAHSSELAHMGLSEVARELPRIRRILLRVAGEASRRRPRAAVLVDSPDFNLRLAKRLAREKIPVILYVSPQLWAWRKGRVRTVRRLAREVLCILPFEVAFYARHGVPARYVGHPLVDDVEHERPVGGFGERHAGRLAMLPGSRAMEVRQLLPAMVRALGALPHADVSECVLIAAPGVEAVVSEVLRRSRPDTRLRVVAGEERRRCLASASLAWTASGTATLECALLDVPMIVGYRLSGLSYWLARGLVRVPHIALVNLIAEQRAAPELVQGKWNPDRLIEETRRLLAGGAIAQRRALMEVRRRLGSPGASRRAAEAVAEHLGERNPG